MAVANSELLRPEPAPSGKSMSAHNRSLEASSASPYCLSLDFFTGPLDLLLHLVERQEVDLENVEMSVVCEQYLEIVLADADVDLNRATEYLVIAATLISMKSAKLLPEEAHEEEVEQGEDFDSRFFEELRERLKAYEQTKHRAEQLRRLPQLGVDTFRRIDKKALQPPAEMVIEEPEDALSLGEHFVRLLKRIGETARAIRIRLEPVSVVNTMMQIVDTLKQSSNGHGKSTFFRLVARVLPVKAGAKEENRDIAIAGFIALLELVKRGLATVSQERDDADFEVELSLFDVDGSELTSEFDDVQPAELDEDLPRDDEHNEKVVHMASFRAEKEESREVDADCGEAKEVNRES